MILEYQEEGWLGKTKNLMKGVIFRYDPANDTKTKIKDVKDDDVVARLEGCWHEEIFYTLGNKSFDKSVCARSSSECSDRMLTSHPRINTS